jgi:CRISPR-associated protein Cas2
MIEPKAGIFLGHITARVRDELWKKAVAGRRTGACLQIWTAPTEQGFQFRSSGEASRELVDFEGLYLVATKQR